MKDNSNRFPTIDFFKATASQLIVMHHLAAYGPLSDAVKQAAPELISWLYDYARMAVQIFFVIGGYLAARAMFPSGRHITALTIILINRYLRLAVPFFVALTIAIICAMIARHWMADDFIPSVPTLSQFLAHVFMLQRVLDFDALLAGAWFIAIDFQLFLLMVAITWLGGKAANSRNIVLPVITLMAAISLFWFNRIPRYDDWAVYFFGAYGMGAVAYWARRREQQTTFWLWLNVSLAIVALMVDFRARILIAVSVALILYFTRNAQGIDKLLGQKLMHYLGKISYSLFLVHFSILMLANAIYKVLGFSDPLSGFVGMLTAWLASLIVADLFYRMIEKPAAKIFLVAFSHPAD